MPAVETLWRCPGCGGSLRSVTGDLWSCLGCGRSETLAERRGKDAESLSHQSATRGDYRSNVRRSRSSLEGGIIEGSHAGQGARAFMGATPDPTRWRNERFYEVPSLRPVTLFLAIVGIPVLVTLLVAWG